MAIKCKSKGKPFKYEISYCVGRDPLTGKQQTCYSTWKAPESWSKTRADKAVKLKEAEFILKCKSGEILPRAARREREERAKLEDAGKPTFNEYCIGYLQQVGADHAENSMAIYKSVLARAGGVFGLIKLEQITPIMMKNYITRLQTETGWRHATIIIHFSVLSTMFNSAVDEGVLRFSPMRDLKRPRRSKNEIQEADERVKTLSQAEVKTLLNCLEDEPISWRAFVIFLLDTGARRGEALGLEWKNVDLDSGAVYFCTNLQYLSDRGLYITTPKTGKGRIVYLTPYALRILKQWRADQAKFLLANGVRSSGFCFQVDERISLHPNTVGSYFRKLGKRCGFPAFHPHVLRHTMASLSITNGADIVSVSKKLGHSQISTTLNVYSHATEEAQRRLNKVLESAIYKEQHTKLS